MERLKQEEGLNQVYVCVHVCARMCTQYDVLWEGEGRMGKPVSSEVYIFSGLE